MRALPVAEFKAGFSKILADVRRGERSRWFWTRFPTTAAGSASRSSRWKASTRRAPHPAAGGCAS